MVHGSLFFVELRHHSATITEAEQKARITTGLDGTQKTAASGAFHDGHALKLGTPYVVHLELGAFPSLHTSGNNRYDLQLFSSYE